jgi:HD-GYP domain-containing protein (c-di-GMP phosphodiesterase class II)
VADSAGDLQAALERREHELRLREAQLERYADDLREVFQQERQRTDELRRSYAATVRALANAVEARDPYTGKHLERVAAYGHVLAEAAGVDIAASPEIEFGFLLHDVGKVAVPDSILFKPDRLTEEEYRLMQRHTVTGSDILREVEFLGEAKEVVRHHHERWDGCGYPDGLEGEEIPLAARVFALADALDALTTNRPYRAAQPFSAAREEIRRATGTQFCPHVVGVYETIPDADLQRIRDRIG